LERTSTKCTGALWARQLAQKDQNTGSCHEMSHIGQNIQYERLTDLTSRG
jgi:hypothetical protein